jgi:hypothetical protein
MESLEGQWVVDGTDFTWESPPFLKPRRRQYPGDFGLDVDNQMLAVSPGRLWPLGLGTASVKCSKVALAVDEVGKVGLFQTIKLRPQSQGPNKKGCEAQSE